MSTASSVQQPQDRWSEKPPANLAGFLTALFFTIVVLSLAGYQFVQDWSGIQALKPVELRLFAYVPENGGWRGDPLQVKTGQEVILHVHAVEGAHSFAIAHMPVQSRQPLLPGEQETVRFVAPEPGRYILYCTTWCSPYHWRMRTVIEVSDPAAPNQLLRYVQEPPRYSFSVEELELDMPHPAPVWPEQPPSARLGADLWQTLAPAITPVALLAELGWPVVTPARVFEEIRAGRIAELSDVEGLTEAEQWALVAYLWQEHTTPAALARGEYLYQQNCADCHGISGEGDGFAAPFSAGIEPDFADPAHAAGASPARYYAKTARGGMGTGMPNWGTIFPEDDLWALTDYLMQFMYADIPHTPDIPVEKEP